MNLNKCAQRHHQVTMEHGMNEYKRHKLHARRSMRVYFFIDDGRWKKWRKRQKNI